MASSADHRRLRLGRRQRLHGPGAFTAARQQGQRRVCGCLIMNWCRLPSADGLRLGVVTARRLGGAVVRNRARRLLREAFRRHQHSIQGPADIVLVARSSLVGGTLAMVERDLCRCLRQAGLWHPEPAGPSSG